MKTKIVLVVSLIAFQSLIAQTWKKETEISGGNFSTTTLNNEVLIAYEKDNKTQVLNLQTGVNIGKVVVPKGIVQADLRIVKKKPFLMYIDADTYKPSTKQFEAGTWKSIANSFSANYVYGLITGENNGVSYLAYSDTRVENKLTVLSNESGSYKALGGEGISSERMSNAAIAFDDKGVLHVAYQGGDKKTSIYLIKYENGTWVEVAKKITEKSNLIRSIQLQYFDGSFYLSYSNPKAGNQLFIKKLNGKKWEDFGLQGLGAGQTRFSNLYVNDNKLYYACETMQGNKAVGVALYLFENGSWKNLGGPTVAFENVVIGQVVFTSDKIYFFMEDQAKKRIEVYSLARN